MLTSLWCCCHPIPALVHCLSAVFGHVTFFLSASHSSIHISTHHLSVHLSVPPSAHCPSPSICSSHTAPLLSLKHSGHALPQGLCTCLEGRLCGLYPPGFLPPLLTQPSSFASSLWLGTCHKIYSHCWLAELPCHRATGSRRDCVPTLFPGISPTSYST